MASIIETTAVSLRKGNTEANQAFTGLLGEVTMDEGIDGTGTDPITTIRLHNGVIAGGIPMCRADLLNISTSQLAVGRDMLGMAGEKNLAYADLSNLISSEDAAVRTNLVNIMKDYGLATTEETDTKLALKANVNMSNVDTASLATSAGHAGKNLAYYDMTNVNSTALTDGSNKLGPVLAKADTSNINTANLVNDSIHNNKPAGNKALMYKDMTNVLSNDLYTALFETHGAALHIEQTTNKLSSYFNPTTGKPLNPSDISANAYPTASAVAAYTTWAIENGSFMRTDLNNATSYEPLYANYGVKLSIPKDDQGQPEYTIESNHINPYKYEVGAGGIITAGSGYVAGRLYTNFVDVSMTTIYNTGNYNQKDRLKVMVTAVDKNGIPTSAIFWQGYGVNNLGSTFTLHLEDDNNKSVVLNCKCTVYDSGLHPGVYAYTVNSISKGSLASAGFKANTVYAPQEEVLVNQLFWVAVDAVNGSGGITKCHFLPELSAHYLDASIAAFNPVRPQGTSSLAEVSFTCTTIMPEIGGAGLAKTDLSNLLGMSQAESEKAEGTPWRAIAYEEIPGLNVAEADTIQYMTLASNGTVHDALKSAESTIHTWAETRIDEKISQYALSDTYRGQVNLFVATENDLPTTGLTAGYKVMVNNYNNTGVPHIYTRGASSWTHEAFIDKTSKAANGDYVYCLDLGEAYHHVPGNLTWNYNEQDLDIAADKYNEPDNVTIIKDESTGVLKLGNFYVPAPEFFNGNGTNKVFTLNVNKCLNGTVPFDVYVDGVFQYPNVAYTFVASTRKITLDFAPQTGTKNVAVIYRGVVFTGSGTAISSSSIGPKGTQY